MEQHSPELSFLLRHPYYAWAAISSYVDLSDAQLHKFANQFFWANVTYNKNIRLDGDFIQEHLPYIPFSDRDSYGGSIEYNDRIVWSVELIKRFYPHWSWQCLAEQESFTSNPVIVAEFMNELAPYYVEQRDETEIEEHPFTLKLKEKARTARVLLENTLSWDDFYAIEDKRWEIISASEKLPWSIERLEKHKDELSWVVLSRNTSLPWSEELIRRFEDKWYWGSKELDGAGLQFNFEIPWNASLLRDFRDRILPHLLCFNTEVDWSIDLLLEFEDWWDYDSLHSNSALWEKVFAGKIGDIDELMLKLG